MFRYDYGIRTVQQLAATGTKWGGTQATAWVRSISEDERRAYQQIVNNFMTIGINNVTDGLSFAVERLQSGYYAVGPYIDEQTLIKLTAMREDLYYAHTTLVIRQGSPLLRLLDDFIDKVTQSGLNIIWEKVTVLEFTDFRRQNIIRFNNNRDRNPGLYPPEKFHLNFAQIIGILYIWIAGCLISISVFLLELTN